MTDRIDLTDPVECEAAHQRLVAMTRQGLAPAPGSPLGNVLKAASEMHMLYASAAGGPASVHAMMAKATAEGRDVDNGRAIAEGRGDAALAMQAKLDAQRARGSHDQGPVERVSNPGDGGRWLDAANAARANPAAIISHAEKIEIEKQSADEGFRNLVVHERIRRGLPVNVIGSEPARPRATTAPVRPAVAPAAQARKGAPTFDIAGLRGALIKAVDATASLVDALAASRS